MATRGPAKVTRCRVCHTTDNLARDRSNPNGHRSICAGCLRLESARHRARAKAENGGGATRPTVVPSSILAADANQVTREQQGNVEVVTTVSRTIRSIEGLLDAVHLDRGAMLRAGNTEWVVESWQANKWDQGVVIDGVHRVVELWQVKATIRRRLAVPVAFAPVRPLALTIHVPKVAATPSGRLLRCLIVPDSQHGFARRRDGTLDPLHDRDAWACMVEVARYARPDHVIFLGDMVDLPDWSDKFVHGPEFDATTQPAMVELAWNLAQARATCRGSQPSFWIEGNHEFRMSRALMTRLRGACELRPVDDPDGPPMLSLERMLNVERLGIRYLAGYPAAHHWLNDNLRVSHGEKARNEPGDTVKSVMRDARNSELFGHLHRKERVSKTTHPRHGTVTYMALCPGTMARIDGAVPAATSRVNWQTGFAFADYEPGDGMFDVQDVSIHKREDCSVAIYDGRVFTGRFDMDALVRATPGWRWAA